jgi:hypothetical protein
VAVAVSYSGVVALGAHTFANGAGSNPSAALTTQDANNWVVGSFGANDGDIYTATSGTIRTQDADNNISQGTLDNTSATAASVSLAVTHNVAGGHWVGGLLELRSTVGSQDYTSNPTLSALAEAVGTPTVKVSEVGKIIILNNVTAI